MDELERNEINEKINENEVHNERKKPALKRVRFG